MSRLSILLLLAVGLLCGCQPNFFAKYYQPSRTASLEDTNARRVAPPPKNPTLYSGADANADIPLLQKHGYVIIGSSSFNGPNVDFSGAKDEAQDIGADLVIVYSKYTNTVSGVTPFVLPTTQTSTTNINGSAYGSGGYTAMTGTATTTSYGSQTMYIPYAVRRSDYLALYAIKIKARFGAFFAELTDEQRQQLESNNGVCIMGVVDESPAFYADILPGDVITQVNGVPAGVVSTLQDSLRNLAGQSVTFTIWRNGKFLDKKVTLNP
jgi:hypothetical protein